MNDEKLCRELVKNYTIFEQHESTVDVVTISKMYEALECELDYNYSQLLRHYIEDTTSVYKKATLRYAKRQHVTQALHLVHIYLTMRVLECKECVALVLADKNSRQAQYRQAVLDKFCEELDKITALYKLE